MSRRWIVVALAVVVPAAAVLICRNIAAQAPLPQGWGRAGSAPQSYTMGIDARTLFEGRSSIALSSKPEANGTGFGTAMQTIDSAHFRGKRVRFSAMFKSQDVAGWAGLWMRVDGPSGGILRFDNMSDRPIKGSHDWKRYDVVLDVPLESVDVAFGVLVAGAGSVWISGLGFEPVDAATTQETAKDASGPSAVALPKEPTLTW